MVKRRKPKPIDFVWEIEVVSGEEAQELRLEQARAIKALLEQLAAARTTDSDFRHQSAGDDRAEALAGHRPSPESTRPTKPDIDSGSTHELSVTEVARQVGVSAGTIRNWIRKGYLRAVALPSGRRRVASEVRSLLAKIRPE